MHRHIMQFLVRIRGLVDKLIRAMDLVYLLLIFRRIPLIYKRNTPSNFKLP